MTHDFGILKAESIERFARDNELIINEKQYKRVRFVAATLQTIQDSANENFEIIIAGGALSRIFRKDTRSIINSIVDSDFGDIDIWSDYTNICVDGLMRTGAKNIKRGANTTRLILDGIPINFIHGYCADPDIILNTFDFNICRFAMNPKYTTLYYAPEAIKDLKTETISFSGSHYDIESSKLYPAIRKARIDKYAAMGYPLCFDDMLNLEPLASVGAVDQDPELLDEEDEYAVFELLYAHIAKLLDEKHNPRKESETPVTWEVFESPAFRTAIGGEWTPDRNVAYYQGPTIFNHVGNPYMSSIAHHLVIRED